MAERGRRRQARGRCGSGGGVWVSLALWAAVVAARLVLSRLGCSFQASWCDVQAFPTPKLQRSHGRCLQSGTGTCTRALHYLVNANLLPNIFLSNTE